MTNYIKIEKIPGNVSTKGHDGWIELLDYNLECRRAVNTYTGCGSDRATGRPVFGDLHIVKREDQSSPLLFQHFVECTNIDEILLDCCQSADMDNAYQQMIISNALITNIQKIGSQGLEYISMDFTKIEQKFLGTDSAHKASKPIACGYDVANAKVS